MQKCIHLHEAIQIALRGAEKLDILGQLEILLGGLFLMGVGGKLDEELFWQFNSFVMLKMAWVNKLWWGGSTGGENNWIFGYCGGPQSSSRENPDMHIEKS